MLQCKTVIYYIYIYIFIYLFIEQTVTDVTLEINVLNLKTVPIKHKQLLCFQCSTYSISKFVSFVRCKMLSF